MDAITLAMPYAQLLEIHEALLFAHGKMAISTPPWKGKLLRDTLDSVTMAILQRQSNIIEGKE